MQNRNYLKVLYDGENVGTLACTKDRQIAFQYDSEWVENGFSLNPFYLPLDNKLYINSKKVGMPFSIFLDSLPDAWGELLLAKKLKEDGIDINELNILDKLALVNDKKKGKLYYEPSSGYKKTLYNKINFDMIQDFSINLIKEKDISKYRILDKVYRLAGSTGGARPKINFLIDNDIYIVKFASHVDKSDIGYMEYKYNEMARECGINVSNYKLLHSNECRGYFATKRFDDTYTVTVAGLLEVEYDIPSIDYNDIFRLVKILTNNNTYEVLELFRRMCFNVFAKNLDDHAKNFSMQYDREKHIWRMSPAYDLTKSTTSFGEHTTTVNGKGKNITDEDLIKVGKKAGILERKLISELEKVKNIVI